MSAYNINYLQEKIQELYELSQQLNDNSLESDDNVQILDLFNDYIEDFDQIKEDIIFYANEM